MGFPSPLPYWLFSRGPPRTIISWSFPLAIITYFWSKRVISAIKFRLFDHFPDAGYRSACMAFLACHSVVEQFEPYSPFPAGFDLFATKTLVFKSRKATDLAVFADNKSNKLIGHVKSFTDWPGMMPTVVPGLLLGRGRRLGWVESVHYYWLLILNQQTRATCSEQAFISHWLKNPTWSQLCSSFIETINWQ